jgi:hypothetical protein
MMESLDSRLQRLAAVADRAVLPSAADVRRHGEDRKRRRRLVVAAGSLILLAGVATPIALVWAGASTQRISPTIKKPTTASSPTMTTTVSLPPADTFNQISVSDGALLLSGYLASNAASSNPTCASAPVDPHTLDIGATTTANCDNPTISGERVSVTGGNVPDTNNGTTRISRIDPQTGQVSVGPVIMTFESLSDTRPVMTYGGGWLWIYDVATISNPEAPANSTTPTTAEVLQVSETTGQVVNTVVMPKLYRPILAANDVGLWLGNSIEGGICEGCSGPPAALYFVAPGSGGPQVAVASLTTPICWLLGAGSSLWIGAGPTTMGGCGTQTIERLNGDNFQPVFVVPDKGYHPLTVIGDEEQGLWTMQWTNPPVRGTAPSPQEIVYINPDTGSERVVADLPARTVPLTMGFGGLTQGQAVVFDGSLYLLEPPFEQNGSLGYSTLVRVRLPSTGSQVPVPTTTTTTTTAPPSGPPVVLAGNGIAGVHFGQSQSSAISGLDQLLGGPTKGPIDMTGNCNVDTAEQWSTLTAYFERGAFVGYGTGAANGEALPQGTLKTAMGLRLGDTITLAEHLYGSAFRTSTSQGGSWSVSTPQGKLIGNLSAVPGQPGPTPTISSIAAGSVGCPAATP